MRDHKSLIAWQRARVVVDLTVEVSLKHWRASAAPYIGQLARAALSSQVNIAEGYARMQPRQGYYHFNVAFGSIVETIDLVEILRDHRMIPGELAERLLQESTRVRALLLGLIHRYGRLSRRP